MDGSLGELDCGHGGAGTREIHRVGPDAAPDLEDALSRPSRELGERRNMWLDEVLPLLDFVEVLARADRLQRVPDVARPRIPERPHGIDRDVGESLVRFHNASV